MNAITLAHGHPRPAQEPALPVGGDQAPDHEAGAGQQADRRHEGEHASKPMRTLAPWP